MDRSLKEIVEYLKTEKIKVSVFGEFSSGKTTFLNALINEDILAVAYEPTTAVPTRIRYGKIFNILVYDNDDRETKYIVDDTKELTWRRFIARKRGLNILGYLETQQNKIKNFLKDCTREGESVKRNKVKEVIIELPIDWLKNKIELIDTPGTNSEYTKHRKFTEKVAEETDIAIMLLTATHGGASKTEYEFMNSVNKHVYKSIIVVNMMDLIDSEEEIIDIMETLENESIRKHWEHPVNPKVYGLSAKLQLSTEKTFNSEILRAKFDNFIKDLKLLIEKNRGAILLKRLGNPDKEILSEARNYESSNDHNKMGEADAKYDQLKDILEASGLSTKPADDGMDRIMEKQTKFLNKIESIKKSYRSLDKEKIKVEQYYKKIKRMNEDLKKLNYEDIEIDKEVRRITIILNQTKENVKRINELKKNIKIAIKDKNNNDYSIPIANKGMKVIENLLPKTSISKTDEKSIDKLIKDLKIVTKQYKENLENDFKVVMRKVPSRGKMDHLNELKMYANSLKQYKEVENSDWNINDYVKRIEKEVNILNQILENILKSTKKVRTHIRSIEKAINENKFKIAEDEVNLALDSIAKDNIPKRHQNKFIKELTTVGSSIPKAKEEESIKLINELYADINDMKSYDDLKDWRLLFLTIPTDSIIKKIKPDIYERFDERESRITEYETLTKNYVNKIILILRRNLSSYNEIKQNESSLKNLMKLGSEIGYEYNVINYLTSNRELILDVMHVNEKPNYIDDLKLLSNNSEILKNINKTKILINNKINYINENYVINTKDLSIETYQNFELRNNNFENKDYLFLNDRYYCRKCGTSYSSRTSVLKAKGCNQKDFFSFYVDRDRSHSDGLPKDILNDGRFSTIIERTYNKFKFSIMRGTQTSSGKFSKVDMLWEFTKEFNTNNTQNAEVLNVIDSFSGIPMSKGIMEIDLLEFPSYHQWLSDKINALLANINQFDEYQLLSVKRLFTRIIEKHGSSITVENFESIVNQINEQSAKKKRDKFKIFKRLGLTALALTTLILSFSLYNRSVEFQYQLSKAIKEDRPRNALYLSNLLFKYKNDRQKKRKIESAIISVYPKLLSEKKDFYYRYWSKNSPKEDLITANLIDYFLTQKQYSFAGRLAIDHLPKGQTKDKYLFKLITVSPNKNQIDYYFNKIHTNDYRVKSLNTLINTSISNLSFGDATNYISKLPIQHRKKMYEKLVNKSISRKVLGPNVEDVLLNILPKSNYLNNMVLKYVQIKLDKNSMSFLEQYVNRIKYADKLHDTAVLNISRHYVKLNQFENAYKFLSILSTDNKDIFHDSLYSEVSHIQARNKNFDLAVRTANGIRDKSKLNAIYYRISKEGLESNTNLYWAAQISNLMSSSWERDSLNYDLSLHYFNTNKFNRSEYFADKILSRRNLQDVIYTYLIQDLVRMSKENKTRKNNLSLFKTHNNISQGYKNDAIRIANKIYSKVLKNRSVRLINAIG